ncbi:MAG: hypothetical protein DRQ39_10680, partial [Gammaproteobacteria bacterium]
MLIEPCKFWTNKVGVQSTQCPEEVIEGIESLGQPCNVYDWLNCVQLVQLSPFSPYDSVTHVAGYYLSFDGEYLVAYVDGLIAGVAKQSIVIFKQAGAFNFVFHKYVLDPNSTEAKVTIRGANEDLTRIIVKHTNTAIIDIYNLIGGVYVQNTIDINTANFPSDNYYYSFNRQFTLLSTSSHSTLDTPIFYFADITGEPGSETILYDANKTIDLSSDSNFGKAMSPSNFTNSGRILTVYPENLVTGIANSNLT